MNNTTSKQLQLPEHLNNMLDAYEENDYYSINCPSFEEVKQAIAQELYTLQQKHEMEMYDIHERAKEALQVVFCKYCNNSGKIQDEFLGNYVPCETENDCTYFLLKDILYISENALTHNNTKDATDIGVGSKEQNV